MTNKNRNASPRTVWGKVVLFLKEHKFIALHVACGDITDVDIMDNYLNINVKDGMLYNLLVDGKKNIESALRWQGLDYMVKINLIEEPKSKAQEDLEKLNLMFGNIVKRS